MRWVGWVVMLAVLAASARALAVEADSCSPIYPDHVFYNR
jgi:hypothetical protein